MEQSVSYPALCNASPHDRRLAHYRSPVARHEPARVAGRALSGLTGHAAGLQPVDPPAQTSSRKSGHAVLAAGAGGGLVGGLSVLAREPVTTAMDGCRSRANRAADQPSRGLVDGLGDTGLQREPEPWGQDSFDNFGHQDRLHSGSQALLTQRCFGNKKPIILYFQI